MLRLRKVELFGFKSFADRTSIVFPGTGIAAVVGPNGCGKSNIADAILWVLGEQSPKTLRSSRMADCIFNGTTDRPPTNLAEVSLTLVNPEGTEENSGPLFSPEETPEAGDDTADTAPSPEEAAEPAGTDTRKKRNKLGLKLQPDEIVVTRRLYRDGKSEYYLNGSLCRLRDIQELFMGTGLGPQSYAIIEQGRIEQILSSRPSDRRALIEEAAGTTKYKTQKRLAEGKLEAAQQNLLRLNDILEEVTKQLNSLKRQASRARRYQEHKAASVALRRVLLATNLEGLAAQESELDEKVSARTGEFQALTSALTEMDEQQSGDHARQFELESLVRGEQNRAGELMVALERTQSRLTDCRRQQEEARQHLERLAADTQLHADEVARNAAALEQARTRLTETGNESQEVLAELEQVDRQAQTLRERIFELETSVGELQQRYEENVEALAAAHAETSQLEQSSGGFTEKVRSFEESRAKMEHERQTLQTGTGETRKRFEQVRGAVIRAQEEAAAASQAFARCQEEHAETKRLLENLRGKLVSATAQEQALTGLIENRTAFADPVRKLLQHGNGNGAHDNGFHPEGVLADFAEFDPAYAELLQNYLKEELEYVVVDNYDSARSGVSILREQTSGRATFIVNSFHRVPVKLPPVTPLPAPKGNGLIGPVEEFLKINGPLGDEAKKVLPRLTNTYLVESADAAEVMAHDYPQHSFLATDGTCYQGRLVSGGAPKAHGAFTLQADVEKASRQRTEIEPQTTTLTAAAAKLAAQLVELEEQRDAARMHLHQKEKELVEAEQNLMAATAQENRLTDSLHSVTAERTAFEEQNAGLTGHLTALQTQVKQTETDLTRNKENLQKQTVEHRQARQESDTLLPRRTDLGARRAALAERLTAGRAELARLEEEVRRLAGTRQSMTSQEELLHVRQTDLQQEEERLLAEVEERRREKEEQETRCHQYDEEHDQLRARLAEKEAKLRQARTELEDVREKRTALEVERARLQSDRQHLETAVQGEFGLTGEELRSQSTERLEGEALTQAEERDRELRRKLDNIGPVNMMALEEFEECQQRHVFLTGQHDDLTASRENIQATIAELDEISHQRFAEAYATINQNFQETFKTLFGGGQATLRLTEADDPSEAGVELICQPPGKRLQNVLLLSGGEKALTALALLIAIFRYKPSPFCILDEVDAPLDDTNIGRFTRMVETMAPQTQFILVTHSKKTMEAASILYGVTMQAAVSQIVSVRFDQKAESAA